MALPTAPLGQLPNLNMPYAIPTYEVRRGRDQVLTALAASIASALGQQAVENAMSRDYAETAGVGENAGFWGKLVQGPKMNRAQFEQANQRAAAREAGDLERTLRSNIANTEADIANRRIDASTAEGMRDRELREKISGAELAQRDKHWQGDDKTRRDLSEAELLNRLKVIDEQGKVALKNGSALELMRAGLELEKLQASYGNELSLLTKRYELEGQSPQGQLYKAQADRTKLAGDLVRGQTGQGSPTPQANSPEAQIANWLAQKQKQEALRAMPFDQAIQQIVTEMDPQMPAATSTQVPLDPALLEFINASRTTQQPRF